MPKSWNVNEIPLVLSFDDVLLVPKYSDINSRKEVDLSTKISDQITLKIPLITTKMDTVTGVDMAIAIGKIGGMGILPRFETIQSQADKVSKVKSENVKVAAAVGVKEDSLLRAESLVNAGVDAINVDVAHGHMQQTMDTTKLLKQRFGAKITIISGISSTYDCANDLYNAGADCILVGVGSGSICTTRIMTGFGIPGLTSLFETAKAARKHGKTFMPDAGIRNSGDIVKALAAGASAIVGGNIFAGTHEAPGKIHDVNGKLYKEYNGSASKTEKVRQVENDPNYKNADYVIHVEGVEGLIPYKGSVVHVVESLLAGVRSGLSYAGARSIPELWEKAEFVRVTNSGLKENGAHDIVLRS